MRRAQWDDRYERCLLKLAEIDGEQGHRVVASLSDIAPGFASYLVQFPFGDIYSRSGLDLLTREVATVWIGFRRTLPKSAISRFPSPCVVSC